MLSYWNDTAAKQRIMQFVEATTTEGSDDYIAPDDRIAVFDNDGTLWVEQPVYTQLIFILDRVRDHVADHPEWQESELLQAALANDWDKLAEHGVHTALELIVSAYAGTITTTEQLADDVREWIAQARDGRFNLPFTELVFAPQLELLAYLRDHGYRTFIVSGGGVEFMRAWAEPVYGIPPEQMVGSSVETVYEVQDGRGVLVQKPAIDFVDDGPGKPVGINKFIGRRPIIAVGNSDGDFEMLEYTTTGDGPRLGIFIHHDDGEREYAYDRDSLVGSLNRGLDEAEERGWLMVSMKNDWNRIFPHEGA